jgi:hypothetical protein
MGGRRGVLTVTTGWPQRRADRDPDDRRGVLTVTAARGSHHCPEASTAHHMPPPGLCWARKEVKEQEKT